MPAQAQSAPAPSSVKIYGIVDVGVEVLGNVNGKGTLARVPSNTGMMPSRLGFQGTENLGGGWRSMFTLEMGLAPDTGSFGQGGRPFGRQSFVGLETPWGTVSLGRQYSMLTWSMQDASPIGPAIYALGSLDAYLPNARTDNALVYRRSFAGLSVGAGYSFGRDAYNAGPSPAGTNCP
ncbi:porin, partial [Acidovorax cavernicola]|uniref:porin n=1 Tax=Acidovorax cavernicola TaxID=1675792 RepID=UPI00257047B9